MSCSMFCTMWILAALNLIRGIGVRNFKRNNLNTMICDDEMPSLIYVVTITKWSTE